MRSPNGDKKFGVLWLKQGDNLCSQMHTQVYVVTEVINDSFRTELSNPKDLRSIYINSISSTI
uniref:Putative ovule protein n=1 Tax=Solanum chacoense TaxID=4108 RepID=A0A0V0HAR7_SOLCH